MACLHPTIIGRDKYPCGKCVNCIKSNQLDYAQIMALQASLKGSAHFITFTYSDDSLPIRVLTGDGELSYLDSNDFCRKHYLDSLDGKIVHKNLGLAIVCGSLRRKDIRMCLKRFRVYYERWKKKKLPQFSYCIVGEMGEKSYRPHYHGLFFGLDDEQVAFLAYLWKKDYGFSLVKNLPVVSNQDVARCCMYVAKYMKKGCSDCPELFLENSLMEKPRVLVSCGISVRQGTLSLLTLDGKLSLNQSYYYLEDIKRVVERMRFHFGGKDFILGKHFYRAALSIPNVTYKERLKQDSVFIDKEFQTSFDVLHMDSKSIQIYEKKHDPSSTRFKASPLQIAISYYLRNLANEREYKERFDLYKTFDSNEDLLSVYGSFVSYEQALQASKEAFEIRRRQQSVAKSVF